MKNQLLNGLPRNLDSLDRLAQPVALTLVRPQEPANAASSPGDVNVSGVVGVHYARIRVEAGQERNGQAVETLRANEPVTKATLEAVGDQSVATLSLPVEPGAAGAELSVLLAGQHLGTIVLPSGDALRRRALMSFDFRLSAYVFSTSTFPTIAYDETELEELIGPHTARLTFYDTDFAAVTEPASPGRYGAILEVAPQRGRIIRRYYTLFRQPQEFIWWRDYLPASLEFPDQAGINPNVAQEHALTVGNFLKERFAFNLGQEAAGAALLVGLFESTPDTDNASTAIPATAANDVWARDRQWWVSLKRKLNGAAQEYNEPFVAPRRLEGAPTPVLREGTLAEAGMKPGTDARIHQVCQHWAADTDEAFAVCVARRGVIFWHHAYRTRDGKPMTTQTGSWMASITKLLAGSLVMMLVDQGRVTLDEPIDTYLPTLSGIPVKTRLTLRHLCTHTNGLWHHVGDDRNDFEEIVADYYPYLPVGQRYEYNGAGCAMAGKVIESVTGEALPQFYRRHLLAPLGADYTDVTNMSWDTFSVPLDIAKIGQMLLNQGSYGDQCFFSRETFQQILPQRLTRVLGPQATEEYGIGTSWFKGEGLGEGTFGHGAASASTLRIDPVNELVIVMARNAAGRNFDQYHPQFLQAIVEGVSRT